MRGRYHAPTVWRRAGTRAHSALWRVRWLQILPEQIALPTGKCAQKGWFCGELSKMTVSPGLNVGGMAWPLLTMPVDT